MLKLLVFALSAFLGAMAWAAPDDGPRDGNGYSVVNDLNNCLRSKAQEVKAPESAQKMLQRFSDLLKEMPSRLLEKYDRKNKFEMEFFGEYLNRITLRAPSSTGATEGSVKKVNGGYDSPLLLGSPTGAEAKKPAMTDKDLLRKMLSDCIEDTDFSELRKKMETCGTDEVGGHEAEKLNKLKSGFLSGGQALGEIKDKAAENKLGANCDSFGQIGSFIICKNKDKIDYYSEKDPNNALMKGCDRLAFDRGSLTCLKESRGAKNALKYKMAGRHLADGKADPKCSQLLADPKSRGTGAGRKERTSGPSAR